MDSLDIFPVEILCLILTSVNPLVGRFVCKLWNRLFVDTKTLPTHIADFDADARQ